MKLLDFYADLAARPKPFGVYASSMQQAFTDLTRFTNYNVVRHTPINSTPNGIETFIQEQLNNDRPVLFYNMLELSNTQYLLNDPVQATTLNYVHTAEFNDHWMTITKYFKDNYANNTYVAFSTWGKRISINIELLKNGFGQYYPDFYAFDIQPK